MSLAQCVHVVIDWECKNLVNRKRFPPFWRSELQPLCVCVRSWEGETSIPTVYHIYNIYDMYDIYTTYIIPIYIYMRAIYLYLFEILLICNMRRDIDINPNHEFESESRR